MHSNCLYLISECILRPLLEHCAHLNQARPEGKQCNACKTCATGKTRAGKRQGHLEERKLK